MAAHWLTALPQDEEERQRHRELSHASKQVHEPAPAPPPQPAYDPFRAAREAYQERQQQAALNARRINADLGEIISDAEG